MEPVEVSIYPNNGKSMNLNELKKVLKEMGWDDGKAYAIVDKAKNRFTIVKSIVKNVDLIEEVAVRNASQMAAVTRHGKKRNGVAEICNRPMMLTDGNEWITFPERTHTQGDLAPGHPHTHNGPGYPPKEVLR